MSFYNNVKSPIESDFYPDKSSDTLDGNIEVVTETRSVRHT